MALPKFVEFIQVLSKTERNSFRLFVLKQFSVEHELTKIVDLAIKKIDAEGFFDDISRLKETYFNTATLKTVQNYFSLLYGLAESWMAEEQLTYEKYTSDVLVYKWLSRKGAHRLADFKYKKMQETFNDAIEIDFEKHLAHFQMIFALLISNNPSGQENGKIPYEDMITHYIEYVSTMNYVLKSELINYGRTINHDFDDMIIKLDEISSSEADSDEYLLSKQMYELVNNISLEAHHFISNTLYSDRLSKRTINEFITFTYFRKFTIRLINIGKLNSNEIIDCINYGLHSGVLTNNGLISAITYHNLIMSISKLKTTEETEEYIAEWMEFTDVDDKLGTRKLAQAQNFFYKGMYNKVSSLIRRTEFKNADQKRLAYVLDLMVSYIERKENPAGFENAKVSFNAYLKRTKDRLSPYIFDTHYNLYTLLKDLSRGNFQYSNTDHILRLSNRSWCQYLIDNKI